MSYIPFDECLSSGNLSTCGLTSDLLLGTTAANSGSTNQKNNFNEDKQLSSREDLFPGWNEQIAFLLHVTGLSLWVSGIWNLLSGIIHFAVSPTVPQKVKVKIASGERKKLNDNEGNKSDDIIGNTCGKQKTSCGLQECRRSTLHVMA